MKNTRDFYLGNPNLPTDKTLYEWTPKMVSELKKSKKDLLYFAENFFHIINLDEGRQKIKLHKCQKRVLKKMTLDRFFILLASRQIGKALALDTPIPTPKGWTTMGKLTDGDVIYGSNGSPCNVVKAHDVMYDRDCYKITFDNGETIVADGDHLWFTQSKLERGRKCEGSVKTTKDIFETINYNSEPMHRIPTNIEGVDGVHTSLPIDPWILGFWLGDGSSAQGTFTVGSRDLQHITSKINNVYDKITIKEYNDNVYTVRASVTNKIKTNSLSGQLRKENLINNKHIPSIYQLSSREQRLQLLQGLIDSDGYITKSGICQFYNSNINLAKQVKELIESLGYKATYKEYYPKFKKQLGKLTACVTFTPIENVATVPFKQSRVRCKPFINRSKYRAHWHYIKKVEKVESVPVRCITVDSDDSLFLAGKTYIPTHNTTLMTIYSLWHACFNSDQRILVVANKEDTAKEIFSRIRMAYEELPNYLKPGVVEYGKESMKLTNGSVIGISTTTGTAARGQSINLMLLDELAFIEPHIVDQFWKSVFPVISSSKKSKIFIASTANGTDNLFYRIWSGAIESKNGWGHDKILWNEIPGRDAMWKYETMRTIGSEEAFSQEFECNFISSADSAINGDIYETLKVNCITPKIVLEEDAYKIWRKPDDGGIYVAGVDVAEGVQQNASCIQILDLRDLSNIEQVATYWSNTIEPYNFTSKLHEILLHWGSPPVLIERNSCGGQVVDQLYKTMRYFNVVNYDIGNKKHTRLGVISHTNSKYRCVSNMRYFINELRAVNIRDIKTLEEIKTFTKLANNKWCARPPHLDDRVMSLGWALLILDNDLIKKFFDVVQYDDNNRPLKLEKYSFDYGTKVGTNLYGWGDEDDLNQLDTLLFNEKTDTDGNSELDWMTSNGWTRADQFQTQRSYTPAANSWLV